MLAAVDVVFGSSSLKISLVHVGSNLNNMELLLIPKISPEGLYFSRALSEGGGGLLYSGKFCLQNRLSWLIFGRQGKIMCYCIVFPSKCKSPGTYIWRGDLTEGFLRYEFGGLIFGGAYTWRDLCFRNFTVF